MCRTESLMSKPLAIAVFGTGPLAQPYLAALHARSDVMVIAIGDVDAQAARQVAAPWSARVWTDPVALLREEAPEAFFALAPAAQLGDALEQAVALHIPCFVEPPGVTDWPAALRLQAGLQAQPLVTAMSFPYRSTDIVREAKEYLGPQPLHLARGTWFVPTTQPLTDLLWNDACHLLDLIRFFLGDIAKVQAVASGSTTLLLTLLARQGPVASVAVCSQLLPEPRRELELPGEKWALHFTENMSRLYFTEPSKTTLLRRMNEPWAEQVAAFLDAVRRQEPTRVISSLDDGLKTLAMCEWVRQALAGTQDAQAK